MAVVTLGDCAMLLLRRPHGLSNTTCAADNALSDVSYLRFYLTRPTNGDNLRSTFRSQRVMMGEKTPAQALQRCSIPQSDPVKSIRCSGFLTKLRVNRKSWWKTFGWIQRASRSATCGRSTFCARHRYKSSTAMWLCSGLTACSTISVTRTAVGK